MKMLRAGSRPLLTLLLLLYVLVSAQQQQEECTSTTRDARNIPRVAATTTTPEVAVKLLKAHGAVVLEDAFNASRMDVLAADLARSAGTFFGAEGSFAGAHTTRNAAKPLGESDVARELATHGLVLHIVRRVLEPHCKRIILGTCSAIDVVPEAMTEDVPARAQPLHRDDSMWGDDWRGYDVSVSVMWAVSDFTADNGATRFLLGSNLQSPRTRRAPPDSDAVPATMAKGSVVLWLGGTFHGAGAPTSVEAPTRRGLLFIYNLGFLRSEHNFHNAIPPDVLRTFPADLLGLLGYDGHNAIDHSWYTGPVYAQPYLGGPAGSASGDGVQFAVPPVGDESAA